MKKSELRIMTVSELRNIVRQEELQIVGAWKMKKDDLVEELYDYLCEAWNIEDDETIVEEQIEEPKKSNGGGRIRKISVYKDGEKIEELPSLTETFKWAHSNKICNQGWVKESLRSGRETVAGRKFKEGGYLFKYSE